MQGLGTRRRRGMGHLLTRRLGPGPSNMRIAVTTTNGGPRTRSGRATLSSLGWRENKGGVLRKTLRDQTGQKLNMCCVPP